MMQFVIKENLLSKVGVVEGTGNCAASLWNMPLAEKRETGNIYTGLKIVSKEKSNNYNGYDRITLAVPDQGEDFLPNFRRGDMVYLYAYPQDEEPTSIPTASPCCWPTDSRMPTSSTICPIAVRYGKANPSARPANLLCGVSSTAAATPEAVQRSEHSMS